MKKVLAIILGVAALLLGWSIPIKESDTTDNIGSGTKPAALTTYYLAGGGISSSATTITLSSFTVPQTDYAIQDSDLSDVFYLTIDPGDSSNQEIISCTTVGTNTGGNVTLSGCTRGLMPIYPYTESSSYKFSHAGGTPVILSNPPQLFSQYGALTNDETITGAWNVPTPTAALGIANKSYVDSIVSGGSVSLDSISVAGTAGETFATGTIVYFDGDTTEWMVASASTTASSTNVQLGIAQGPGTDGASITGGVLTRGYDTTQTGMTTGATMYLSDTGTASSTTGTYSVVIGQARTSSLFYFDPVYGNYANPVIPNTFTASNTFSDTTNFTATSSFSIASTTKQYFADGTSQTTAPVNNLVEAGALSSFTNDATEYVIASTTISGGILDTDDIIKITGWYDAYDSDADSEGVLRIKYGGTACGGLTLTYFQTSGSTGIVYFSAIIQSLGASSQRCMIEGHNSTAVSEGSTNTYYPIDVAVGTMSIDSTQDQNLTITFDGAAGFSTNGHFTGYGYIIEHLNND